MLTVPPLLLLLAVLASPTRAPAGDHWHAERLRAPPDGGFGTSSDADYAQCVLTCRDLRGEPAPQLCRPLPAAAAAAAATADARGASSESPIGVVAVDVGGPRDASQYGSNGSEWRQWLPANGNAISSVPVFNSAAYGFSSGLNAGLLCAAHARGIRILDTDIVGGMFGGFNLEHSFLRVENRTAMLEYVELAVHVMVGYGIDGFALDVEGSIYSVLESNAAARAGWTDFLVTLKARMVEAVPGAHLSVWCATTGGPWNRHFAPAQIDAAVEAVDEFLIMGYSLCTFMVANAPLPTLAARFDEILGRPPYGSRGALGIPAAKWVLVLPWWGCDFNCKANSSCPLLRGPLRYRHNTPLDPGLPNDALGYAQIEEKLALSRAQGRGPQLLNTTSQTVYFQYENETTKDIHEVWYDNATTLRTKYDWAVSMGMRAVGMWTPGAAGFDAGVQRDLWASIPMLRI